MEMHVTFPGGKRVNATFDRHVVHTDQDGEDPSPFELFLASLATCTGYYVLAYCDARRISTDNLEVVQRTIYSADGKTLTDIALEVHLPADFPEAHRAGVVRAAESCKVKKLLARPPAVSVTAIARP